MTIASTLGSVTGNTAAYTKHAVLMTGIGGIDAVTEFIVTTRESYALKDAELAQRRQEYKQAAIANGAVKVYPKRVAKQA